MAEPRTPALPGKRLIAFTLCGVLTCAACAGSPAARPITGGCTLQAAALLTSGDMRGTVQLFRNTHSQLAGSHGIIEPWDVAQYLCGEDDSFISDAIMYGRYRVQDDALARSLGYTVGKWPLLPYQGPAVSALPQAVFETYEEIYQFRTAKAAATWLADLRATPNPNDIPGLPLPAGFIARTEVLGPDDGQHEHAISIGGQHDDELIFVSFRGGLKLSWTDVQQIWLRAYALISRTFTS